MVRRPALWPEPSGDQRPPRSLGNKARRWRKVPILADLVESLADLAYFGSKDGNRPVLDIFRQPVGEATKRAPLEVAIDPSRAISVPFATPAPAVARLGPSASRCYSSSCGTGW